MIGKRFYTYSPIQNIPAEYTSTRAIFLKYSAGQFAGPVIFYLLEILTIGQFAGQLSNIFSNSWGQSAIGPVAKAQQSTRY